MQGLYGLARVYLQRKGFISGLRHQQNINQRWGPKKETPLHLAARGESPDIVKLLLSCGADVASEDTRGQTPLHLAILYSTVEVYQLLSGSKRSGKVYRDEVERYTKNNNKGVTVQGSLLHLPAQHGWESVCGELIKHHNYDLNGEYHRH